MKTAAPKMVQKNVVRKSRKEIRKSDRIRKKAKRAEHYTNRNRAGKVVLKPGGGDDDTVQPKLPPSSTKPIKHGKATAGDAGPPTKLAKNANGGNRTKAAATATRTHSLIERHQAKERREQMKLKAEMKRQRSRQLEEANRLEDRNIRRLEKQLKLNKRKSRMIPRTFAADGLDYLLEVCDSENLKDVLVMEQNTYPVTDGEFREDVALMSGPGREIATRQGRSNLGSGDAEPKAGGSGSKDDDTIMDVDQYQRGPAIVEGVEGERFDASSDSDDESDVAMMEDRRSASDSGSDNANILPGAQPPLMNQFGFAIREQGFASSTMSPGSLTLRMRTRESDRPAALLDQMDSTECILAYVSDKSTSLSSCSSMSLIPPTTTASESSLVTRSDLDSSLHLCSLCSSNSWTDCYGRVRDEDGNFIDTQQQGNSKGEKYIPPAVRARFETANSSQLIRLKRQLKGFLNRLAEGNMHNISNQIETLYMSNSRNDMNNVLTHLIFDSLITNVAAPDRLLLEHVLLISILHANVGSEVGAHFLQCCAKKFHELSEGNKADVVEDKQLDNVVNIIAQLYNFKLFNCRLLYDILSRLTAKFDEKHVECILHVLRSVGFTLRKENPGMLKDLILNLQKRAANDIANDNPRVKYMLNILLAIKNNNVNKIPNYDTTYSEHLKKISKNFVRKGNYLTQLNIGLEDLLKADERGKWWVIGSAWTGSGSCSRSKETATTSILRSRFSEKLLTLAKKERMNTETRRNIFCIIMSAEDFLDAFEKLMHLGLKNQQEREIINILLHCCLAEKKYNPYYSVLAQKFCDYDRKFQMMIKYAIWDKLKAINDCSPEQIANLAKLLTHLFISQGISISTLKIMEFGELDKITLRFVRQILVGVLMTPDVEQCQEVFEKILHSERLKMFRERMRLFIHHFLLRNLKTETGPTAMGEAHIRMLELRAKMIENMLNVDKKK